MKRQEEQNLVGAFRHLAETAEQYVNRSPKAKRIQTERAALLDAIAEAQLVLSIHRLPQTTAKESAHTSSASDNKPLLEEELKKAQAALRALEHRLRPLSIELEQLERSALNAQGLLKSALADADVPAEGRAA
jgi:hypothetical protein